MKRLSLGYIIPIIMFVFLNSCTKEKATQRILGAGDCMTCDGWSWSNGEASTTKNDYDEISSFSFKTAMEGELSFSYMGMNQYTGNHRLTVYVGGKMYFEYETTGYSYTSASLGTVKKGEVVSFYGRRYRVKDIMIVGEPGGSGDSPDDPEHQWDF